MLMTAVIIGRINKLDKDLLAPAPRGLLHGEWRRSRRRRRKCIKISGRGFEYSSSLGINKNSVPFPVRVPTINSHGADLEPLWVEVVTASGAFRFDLMWLNPVIVREQDEEAAEEEEERRSWGSLIQGTIEKMHSLGNKRIRIATRRIVGGWGWWGWRRRRGWSEIGAAGAGKKSR